MATTTARRFASSQAPFVRGTGVGTVIVSFVAASA